MLCKSMQSGVIYHNGKTFHIIHMYYLYLNVNRKQFLTGQFYEITLIKEHWKYIQIYMGGCDQGPKIRGTITTFLHRFENMDLLRMH